MHRRIAGYELTSELGQGAMATVYHARRERPEPKMPDEVAIKLLRREYLADLGFRARFEREGETITALQHTAIVPVYEFGQYEKQLYLVMAYMPHGSLAERLLFRNLEDGGATASNAAWAMEVLERVGAALDYAHSQGVVHRDLKPSNVLFDAEDRAFLTDFGIAWQTGLDGRRVATVTGTPAYMSPEQAGVAGRAGNGGDGGAGEQVDGSSFRTAIGPASDIYALGVLAFRLLVGQLPFRAESPVAVLVQHVHEAPPSPREINPALPEGVEQVLLKALAKDPAQRFGSAGAFVEALGSGGLEIGDWGLETGRLETGRPETEGLETDALAGASQVEGGGDNDEAEGVGWAGKFRQVGEAVYGWLVARPMVAFGLVTVVAILCAFGSVQLLRGWSGEASMPPDSDLQAVAPEGSRGAGVGASGAEVFLPLTSLEPGRVTPTATAAPTPSANVRLLYDGGKVTLLNISGAHLSLSDVALRRVRGDGPASPTLEVSVLNRVAGGAVSTLPPGDCLQLLGREAVRTRRAGKPAECDTLRGWLATRETNQLFEGVADGDVFEVLQGEQVLQRCTLAEGSCQFFVAQAP